MRWYASEVCTLRERFIAKYKNPQLYGIMRLYNNFVCNIAKRIVLKYTVIFVHWSTRILIIITKPEYIRNPGNIYDVMLCSFVPGIVFVYMVIHVSA